jgi:hypothetical protein
LWLDVVGRSYEDNDQLAEGQHMANSWDDLTDSEKLDILARAMTQIQAAHNALTSDLDKTWDALRATKSELGKMTKEVSTLRALWPKKYSRTG